MRLNPIVIKVLKQAGWYEGRNVFDQLVFLKQKDFFPEAKRIISEYGLLKIEYQGREGSQPHEIISLDVDESRKSQLLRANYWGFNTPEEITPEKEPDFIITEDFKLTANACKKIGERCFYIGFLEDYTGFDLYVVPNGKIYVDHWKNPKKWADSFEDFLNKTIIGTINDKNIPYSDSRKRVENLGLLGKAFKWLYKNSRLFRYGCNFFKKP